MPSQTFFNLTEEKRQKLIEASINEFSKSSFYDASINNIINEAKISRGSFYMYFQDKEDLYKYLLENHKNTFIEIFIDTLKENDGDLKESAGKILEKLMEYTNNKNHIEFFKKYFSNLSVKTEKLVFPRHNKECLKTRLDPIIKYIDTSKLNIIEDDDIYEIFDMVLHLIVPSIVHINKDELKKELILERFNKKLDILCRGIYRKEDNNDKNV